MLKYALAIWFLLSSVLLVEAGVPGTQQVRFRLAADTTFYVSTAGNDMAGDGSSGAPWATIQMAYNWIADNLDFAGHTVQIFLAPGVYTYGVMIDRPWVGGGNLIINGGGATINSNKQYVGIFDFMEPIALTGTLQIENMTLTSNVAAFGINAECWCTVMIGQNVVFGQFALIQISAMNGGYVYCQAGYLITGGAEAHYNVENGGYIQCPRLIQLSGTPNFGTFAFSASGGRINLAGTAFTGSATGQKYYIGILSILQTQGNLSALPGNASGYLAQGGFAS